MASLVEYLSWILIIVGSVFSIIGAIGLLRFPDFFSRLHAAGITDTVGAWSIILGFLLQAGITLTSVKLIMIIIFLFFTSPTSTHALARAGLAANLKPWQKNKNETGT